MYQLLVYGGLAQLARAPALHAGGHRFDSDILHQADKQWPMYIYQFLIVNCSLVIVHCKKFIDILEQGIQRHMMLLYIPKKKETRIFIK